MGGNVSVLGLIFGQLTCASQFGRAGYEKACRAWNPKELEVDLTGKTYLVTGANSGIGKATAEGLAQRKATVYLLCRNAERAEQAKNEIVTKTGNPNVHVAVVDMSLMADVRRFASEFLASSTPIAGLVHNAGALLPKKETTSEGNEVTLATHVLGPHLLTALLEERLKASAPSRVIIVSSGGMYTQKLDVNDLQSEKRKYDGSSTYAQMKRAQIILTEQWAERFKASNVTVNSMHPGWVQTPGLQGLFEDKPMYRRFESGFRTVEQGADTIVWMCANPNLEKVTGKFFFDRAETSTNVRCAGTDSSAADRAKLWEACCNLTGWKEGLSSIPTSPRKKSSSPSVTSPPTTTSTTTSASS